MCTSRGSLRSALPGPSAARAIEHRSSKWLWSGTRWRSIHLSKWSFGTSQVAKKKFLLNRSCQRILFYSNSSLGTSCFLKKSRTTMRITLSRRGSPPLTWSQRPATSESDRTWRYCQDHNLQTILCPCRFTLEKAQDMSNCGGGLVRGCEFQLPPIQPFSFSIGQGPDLVTGTSADWPLLPGWLCYPYLFIPPPHLLGELFQQTFASIFTFKDEIHCSQEAKKTKVVKLPPLVPPKCTFGVWKQTRKKE